MLQPGRSFNSASYRYGFQKQEIDREIEANGNVYTAQYWEYDSRIGRRWNVDPVVKSWESGYATFDENPISHIDPDGRRSTHTDENGNVTDVRNDGDPSIYKHKDPGEVNKLYSPTNTSAGGVKVGVTLMWNSFTNRGTENRPGGQISFGSYEAMDWLANFTNQINQISTQLNPTATRMDYAIHAGNGDIFDFKTKGMDRDLAIPGVARYILRGSQISTGVYVSARDVGNFAAGTVARLTGENKMDFMVTAGAFEQSGNDKWAMVFRLGHWKDVAQKIGWPAFGEKRESSFFQRLGFENITNPDSMKMFELRIWDGHKAPHN